MDIVNSSLRFRGGDSEAIELYKKSTSLVRCAAKVYINFIIYKILSAFLLIFCEDYNPITLKHKRFGKFVDDDAGSDADIH